MEIQRGQRYLAKIDGEEHVVRTIRPVGDAGEYWHCALVEPADGEKKQQIIAATALRTKPNGS